MPLTTQTGLISDQVFSLPAQDVHRSCGLALDIGSSMGKIVYRSNKEYKNGQPIKPQDDATRGQVHCAMFPRTDVAGIIDYIKDNCDLTADAAGEIVVMSCGLGGAAYRTKIEAELNSKMKILPEFDCFCQAFMALEKTTAAADFIMPLSPENQSLIEEEKEKHKVHFKETMEKMRLNSQMKAIVTPQVQLKEEERPRLMLMAGSGSAMIQLDRDGTYGILDGVVTGGRCMYGLACILTGETDFDKLVEMAKTSDGKTVDLSTSDLIGDSSTAGCMDNLYERAFRDKKNDRKLFSFGKGVTTSPDEMKKGDLVYSVFNTTVETHAGLISTSVRLSKAKEVYVAGNLFNTEFMKMLLCRTKAHQGWVNPPDVEYELKFLRHGGMFGALGAFLNTQ